MERVLVVGAGAVGQVYAAALERGGAEVTFHVRPKHQGEVEGGLRLSRLRLGGRREPHVFAAPRVTTTVEEARAHAWDAVWLCIPSNGVHEPGTAALLEALRGVLVVSLTPGLDDRARLLERVDEANLVTGLVPFLAWSESAGAQGAQTVCFFPPLSACAFEGARAKEAVAALRRGGLRARVQPNLGRVAPFGTAMLLPMVAELETGGWRFASFDAAHRRRFRRANAEAARVVAAEVGARRPWSLRLAPWLVRPFVLGVARALLPLDLEAFLRAHFLKVGLQTTRSLDVYIDRAHAHGLAPVPALEALRATRDVHLP